MPREVANSMVDANGDSLWDEMMAKNMVFSFAVTPDSPLQSMSKVNHFILEDLPQIRDEEVQQVSRLSQPILHL